LRVFHKDAQFSGLAGLGEHLSRRDKQEERYVNDYSYVLIEHLFRSSWQEPVHLVLGRPSVRPHATGEAN
jgi:hypothetical protein